MKPLLIDFASYIGPGYFFRLWALEEAFAGVRGSGFLEIGSGRGDIAAWLVSRGWRGTLVETSPAAIDFLRDRFAGEGAVSIAPGTAAPEVAKGGFDLAIALEVLEHVPDDVDLLRTMTALLEPGGAVVVSVPAFMKNWGRLDDFAGHLRRYERSGILELFSEAGLELSDLTCFGFPGFQVFELVRRAYYAHAFRKVRHESEGFRTSRSGVDRPMEVRSRFFVRVLNALMAPMLLVQHATLHHDLGGGWIAVARKPLGEGLMRDDPWDLLQTARDRLAEAEAGCSVSMPGIAEVRGMLDEFLSSDEPSPADILRILGHELKSPLSTMMVMLSSVSEEDRRTTVTVRMLLAKTAVSD